MMHQYNKGHGRITQAAPPGASMARNALGASSRTAAEDLIWITAQAAAHRGVLRVTGRALRGGDPLAGQSDCRACRRETLAEVLIGARHVVVPFPVCSAASVRRVKSLGLIEGREHGDGDGAGQ